MKKLISVAFAGVAAAACAFAFTACGDKNQETSYTVNETEWKSAINFIIEGKNNFECKWSYNADGESGTYILKYDYENSVFGFKDVDNSEMEVYGWKEAEGDFRDSAYGSKGYSVYKTTEEEFKQAQKDNILSTAAVCFCRSIWINSMILHTTKKIKHIQSATIWK